MKYLEDDRLSHWTVALTDAPVYHTGSMQPSYRRRHNNNNINNNCDHQRVLFGRMEAYTMKRTVSDKKYAHALGAKFVAEMELLENELAALQQKYQDQQQVQEQQQQQQQQQEKQLFQQQDAAAATGSRKSLMAAPLRGRKRSQSTGTMLDAMTQQQQHARPAKLAKQQLSSSSSSSCRRIRSCSFDSLRAQQLRSAPSYSTTALQSTSLGDFMELGTRRLMTDLILTLNASFPDYDFSNVRPHHFVKLSVAQVMESVNQRLSQWALQQEQTTMTSSSSILNEMWKDMDQAIQLADCQVFSYVPPPRDTEDDPLSFLTQTLVVGDDDDDNNDYYDYDYDAKVETVGARGGRRDVSSGGGGGSGSMGGGCGSDGPTSVVPLWSFNYFFVNKKGLKRILFFTAVEVMKAATRRGFYDDDDDDEEGGHGGGGSSSSSRVPMGDYIVGSNDAAWDFDLDPAANVAGGIPVASLGN